MFLLDTHVLHWLAADQPQMGKKTRQLIHETPTHALYASGISFWELGLLLRRKRLVPPLVADIAGLRAGLEASGYQLLALSLDAVFEADRLVDFHGDPGDRFLAGTAVLHGLELITADRKILDWSGPLKRIDARL